MNKISLTAKQKNALELCHRETRDAVESDFMTPSSSLQDTDSLTGMTAFFV